MVNLIYRSSVEDTSGKVTAFMIINEYEQIRYLPFTLINDLIW